jgi:hypothetical protein
MKVRPATGGTEARLPILRSSVMGQSMDRCNQFCLFCAAVHFLESAGLSSANLPGVVRVTALAVSRAMSDRSVTLPV